MAALALEHESRKEMRRARQLTQRIRRIGRELGEPRVTKLGDQVEAWVERIEEKRRLFAPLLNDDDRDTVEALSARSVLAEVVENVKPLVSGLGFMLEVPEDIFLPAATFAEWNSLFQKSIFEHGKCHAGFGRTSRILLGRSNRPCRLDSRRG